MDSPVSDPGFVAAPDTDELTYDTDEEDAQSSPEVIALLIKPREWRRCIRVFSHVFFLFYLLLEALVRVFEHPCDVTGVEDAARVLRTPRMRHHPKRRRFRDLQHDVMGSLNGWLKGIIVRTSADFPYDSPRDFAEFFFRGCKMSAHTRLCAHITLCDRRAERTMSRVQKAVTRIHARADVSDKFTFLYYYLLPFLADLGRAEPGALAHFVTILAEDMLVRPVEAFHTFIHQRMRDDNVPTEMYETTMAIMSLFIEEGASVWRYTLDAGWRASDRPHHAALTLLMFAAVERCASPSAYKVDPPRDRTVARVLQASPDQAFRRFRSLSATTDDTLFRDRIMLDITLNNCNEFVEAAWPTWLLDRAVWALQFGRRHMTTDNLLKIVSQEHVPGLDYTAFSPLMLLSFSVSGIVRFRGKHENVYNITSYAEAKIVTHGFLPQPTVKDLITLGLVKQMRRNKFCVTHIPGSQSGYKAVHHNHQMFFEPHSENEPFHSTLSQRIG